MKKILLSSLLACALFAAEENYVELGFGSVSTKDNFSSDSKDTISALSKAKSERTTIPYFEFLYAYELNENMNIYINSQFEDLRIGSKIDSNYGLFDFGFKTSLMDKEWRNPYQTGTKRKTTDTKEFGVYLGYGLSFNEQHNGTIKYEYSSKKYDKDDLTGDLKRDGDRAILSFENIYNSELFGKENAYIGNLTFEGFEADGKSNSYGKYDIELGTSIILNDAIKLSLLANFGEQEYLKYNTAVKRKVKVQIYGTKAILNWDKPFNYKNTYASLKSGYEKEEANANFYDAENTFGIFSIGYLF